MSAQKPIGVIGAGAWGTALAQMLAADGAPVSLWARTEEVAGTINRTHRNELYLPGATLSGSITASSDLPAFAELDTLLIVPPAQHLGSVMAEALSGFAGDAVLCAKGIEAGSGRLMAEVAHDVARVLAGQLHFSHKGEVIANENVCTKHQRSRKTLVVRVTHAHDATVFVSTLLSQTEQAEITPAIMRERV